MKKILLVDDDADFVQINRMTLERNGYAVVAASNGKDGFRQAQREKPDLIVLDVIMSTKSEGFDVSRELRRCDQTKHIPILMITSVNETVPFKFEPDATWLPVDRFLEKPVKPKQLLENVQQMLR